MIRQPRHHMRPALGTVQVLTCGCQTLTHFWRFTFLELLKRYEGGAHHDRDIESTIREASRPVSNPAFFARFLLRLSFVAMTDVVLMRTAFFFACALLGVAVRDIYIHIYTYTHIHIYAPRRGGARRLLRRTPLPSGLRQPGPARRPALCHSEPQATSTHVRTPADRRVGICHVRACAYAYARWSSCGLMPCGRR